MPSPRKKLVSDKTHRKNYYEHKPTNGGRNALKRPTRQFNSEEGL